MKPLTSFAALLAVLIAGCGKRATCIVIGPDNGSGCFAGGGRTEIQ